jgi:hypothetical protein
MNGQWDAAVEKPGSPASGWRGRRTPSRRPRRTTRRRRCTGFRGELDLAEASYLESHRLGREPQPGLSLLRLAQGAEMRGSGLAPAGARPHRPTAPAGPAPAGDGGDRPGGRRGREAAQASSELERSRIIRVEVLAAMAAHARGTVLLTRGESAQRALDALRPRSPSGKRLGARAYLAARVRVSAGSPAARSADEDGAALELAAAPKVFEELGARPDLRTSSAHGPRRPAASGWADAT